MKLKILLLSLLLIVGCTSSPDEDEVVAESEISEETQNIENQNPDEAALDSEGETAATEETPAAENTEAPQEEAFADEENIEEEIAEQNATEEPAAAEESAAAEEPPAPVDIEEENQDVVQATTEDAAPTAERVKITGLDFKANENGGTIVVSTNGNPTFTTEENAQNNQFILNIENAVLPKQFTRPYNTKEFSGPIGMISAFKNPGSDTARIVVQLKSPTQMSVVQEGNALLLVPGGTAVAQADEPQAAAAVEEAPAEPSVQVSEEEQAQALESKTLDEFLTGESKFYGKRISVEVVDGEIRDVISFISEESGVNLVLSDEVKGKISVKLRQIPWDQALVVIMQTKQLGYIRQGNILRIAPLTAIRSETDSARQLLEAQKQLEPLKTKVFPISYAKSKDIEAQASSFLSTRGSVKADERMNAIVVKDLAENIAKIENLVARLDTQTPQVMIEGKIVETRQQNLRTLGILWSTTGTAGFAQNLVTNSLTKSASVALAGQLRILEEDDKVKILSSPRVVVLNNQTATIEQSNQFPIKTSNTVDGNVTETIEYKTVKLSLNVTPQIATDGGVILKTDILREFAGAVDTVVGSDTGARPINSRSAKTTILVENGQTAVLGGIFQSDNTESSDGIPLLKDIPLLGYFFGQRTTNMDKNELVIFLTPRILNRDRAFQLSSGEGENNSL